MKTSPLSRTELINHIKTLEPALPRPVFVAISGFGGSGKSTLAKSVSQTLDVVNNVIPIDDFIIGKREQRSTDWRTFDRQRLQSDVIEVAHIGESLSYQIYNSGEWVNGKGGVWREIEVGKVVIIEGCGIIHPDLMNFYDYSVWIDCPQKIALSSSRQRDVMETELFRGEDTNRLWDEVWGPNDKDYFERFRPDRLVDVLMERQF